MAAPGGDARLQLTLLSCLLIALTAASVAWPAAPPSQERPRYREEKNRLVRQAKRFRSAGDLTQAITTARTILTADRVFFGPSHEQVADSLAYLGELYLENGDCDATRKAHQEELALRVALHGSRHWKTNTTRLGLEHLQRWVRLKPQQRQALFKAQKQRETADRLMGLGYTREAITMADRAMATTARYFGTDTLPYAEQLLYQAVRVLRFNEFKKAESLCRRARAIYEPLVGEDHRDHAAAVNLLGILCFVRKDYTWAEYYFRRSLAVRKRILPEVHPTIADNLRQLNDVYDRMSGRLFASGDRRGARTVLQKALNVVSDLYGPDHWQVQNVRLALAHLEGMQRLTAEETRQWNRSMRLRAEAEKLRRKDRLDEAIQRVREARALSVRLLGETPPSIDCLNTIAELHQQLGHYAEADSVYQKALKISATVYGPTHPQFAACLGHQVRLCRAWYEQRVTKGDHKQARQLLQRLVDIQRQRYGADHWKVTEERLQLAEFDRLLRMNPDQHRLLDQAEKARKETVTLVRQGKYAAAIKPARKAIALTRTALGEQTPETATALNNLGFLYERVGDTVEAETNYQQALTLRAKVYGKGHPLYAQALHNLANLYLDLNDLAQAERLSRQALQIRSETLGEEGASYAASLNQLGMLYIALHEPDRAEPLLRQALPLQKEARGEKSSEYARALNNLAGVYREMGEIDLAEPLFLRAAGVWKEIGQSAEQARALDNLAMLALYRGDHAAAEQYSRTALALFRESLGEQHRSFAISQANQGAIYFAQGKADEAEPLVRASLQREQELLEMAASVLSERQQLAMARKRRTLLDVYLSLAPRKKVTDADTYAHVLAWKGTVFARQRARREAEQLVRGERDPEAVRLWADLGDVSARLAQLALSTPAPAQLKRHRQELEELTQEKERLEQALNKRSAPFRQLRQRMRLTSEGLQKALPRGTALVDFFEYQCYQPEPKQNGRWNVRQHLVAFVIRPGKRIERVDLGPSTPISKAVAEWRKRFGVGPSKAIGLDLRERIWKPLEKSLAGIDTVLVCPDGVLASLPLGALPGKKPGTFLLEEVAIAVVPVPQLLPTLLAGARPAGAEKGSLLLVGGIDYDGPSGQRGRDWRGALLPAFRPLSGADGEVKTLEQLWRRRHPGAPVQLLRAGNATKAAVQRIAPGQRWLHLATHGFFAPAGLRSALASTASGLGEMESQDLFGRAGVSGFHPGLLSGLALSGANHRSSSAQEEGILTALEVAALDLGAVELATLSACETGLGELAGGEGVLGLQRAFQEAGARSVVASLWQVHDRATQTLMERFYDNLWGKKMSKMKALRQAQLWLLREGAGKPDLVRGGLSRLPEQSPEKGRLPPYYWAAFVLSGDWR